MVSNDSLHSSQDGPSVMVRKLVLPCLRVLFFHLLAFPPTSFIKFSPFQLLVMKVTAAHNERIAKMTFASVYPHYVTKVEKKGRTTEELQQVITWLTGFDKQKIQEFLEDKSTFATFFAQAALHPNAHLIKGVICGYRIEEIDNPLTQQVRYLDKLVDELAKGRKLEKILRQNDAGK